jgi:hypothetical protein
MNHSKLTHLACGVLTASAALGAAWPAAAARLDSTATFLGGTNWQIDYALVNNGPSFAFDQFTVYFESGLFSGIAVLGAPAGWDALAIQPDLGLSADGYYDALRLGGQVPASSSSTGFSASFSFLGMGVPQAQRFELVNSIDLSVVYTGLTTPVSAVPEPYSYTLMLAGLAALAQVRKKART